jgi:hypothetical protein
MSSSPVQHQKSTPTNFHSRFPLPPRPPENAIVRQPLDKETHHHRARITEQLTNAKWICRRRHEPQSHQTVGQQQSNEYDEVTVVHCHVRQKDNKNPNRAKAKTPNPKMKTPPLLPWPDWRHPGKGQPPAPPPTTVRSDVRATTQTIIGENRPTKSDEDHQRGNFSRHGRWPLVTDVVVDEGLREKEKMCDCRQRAWDKWQMCETLLNTAEDNQGANVGNHNHH